MGATLIPIGLLCIIAAVVGGGVKLAGGEIPAIGSVGRQLALGTVGVAVVAGGWYLDQPTQFRVTSATVLADTSVAFLCPQTVGYTAIVDVTGGTGTVEYRFVFNGIPQQAYSLAFNGEPSKSISTSAEVTEPLLPALQGTPATMAIEILTPNRITSPSAETDRRCSF